MYALYDVTTCQALQQTLTVFKPISNAVLQHTLQAYVLRHLKPKYTCPRSQQGRSKLGLKLTQSESSAHVGPGLLKPKNLLVGLDISGANIFRNKLVLDQMNINTVILAS